MTSIIIAAHNEEAVIGGCLEALEPQTGSDIQIIVSANGCNDRTAEIAGTFSTVTVVDRPEPGKAGALNAADAVASSHPRIYLDADIIVPAGGVQRLVTILDESSGVFAAVPRRRIDTQGRPLAVKAYFAINERLPVFRDGLFGRGMIAISEAGRRRFDRFPDMIADDLFLDSLFTDDEKTELVDVEVLVAAPYRTRDLLNRLVRVRRGNRQMREASSAGELDVEVRRSDKWAWLRDVVVPEPRLAVAAVPYIALTTLAGLRARRENGAGWERDLSTRTHG